MLFYSIANFVVGLPLNLFSARGFINGAIVFFPILLLFTPLFLFLTLIRHPKYNKIFGSITIALLSLATWIFLVPAFYSAGKSQNVFYRQNPGELTAGYFRKINGKINYFTFASGNYASGIRFDEDYFNAGGHDDKTKNLDSSYINYKRDELGFFDPIIGGNLEPPPVLLGFLNGIATIQQKGFETLQGGILEWLLFSSIMAALVSIGAVISASEWRLADAFYITFDTLVILALNCLCILGHFEPLSQSLYDLGGIFTNAASHFQTVVNCAAIFVISSLGIFKGIVHAAKRRRSAR